MEKVDMDELVKLLNEADPEQLRVLANKLTAEPKPRRPKVVRDNGPVKHYTTIIKETTCLLCGSVSSRKYNLERGDNLMCIDPKGAAHMITSTGKAGEILVPNTTSRCFNCERVIKYWTREKLERRFLFLLSQCSFKEVANYAAVVVEDDKTFKPKAELVVYEGRI